MKLLLKKHDKNSIGLIGHTIVNYPNADLTRQAIDIMVEAGVSLIELQIPFSEPIADGPLFTHANHQALAQGVNIEQSFALMAEVSRKHAIPFVFMTYGNVLYQQGYERFVIRAKEAGAQGIIVPDLPIDQTPDLVTACQQHQLAWIQVIPPNATEQRLSLLAKASQGFIYAVARSGVTGAKTALNQQLTNFITRIRQYSDLPIAVGFGIASPQDVAFLRPIADYAIVGSAALRILQEGGVPALRKFWFALSEVLCSSR